MSNLERYTVSMPRDLFVAFDEWLRRHSYSNRSEALRDLVRAALVEQQWTDPEARVVASLTLVYDHHVHDLGDKLTHIQHQFGDLVISTMHVHLDHHNCLEVIVMRGRADDIRKLADATSTAKGVKHARLALTTEGASLA